MHVDQKLLSSPEHCGRYGGDYQQQLRLFEMAACVQYRRNTVDRTVSGR
jgi:hypothetical protein